MANEDSVTYSELITEVDAAITAIEKVEGVDPRAHLKPLVRELQRIRRRHEVFAREQDVIYVPNGTRRKVGLD